MVICVGRKSSRRMRVVLLVCLAALAQVCSGQSDRRRVGRLREVYAWKQITFNINGQQLLQDRAAELPGEVSGPRAKRQEGFVFPDDQPDREWNPRPSTTTSTTASPSNNNEAGRFFIQYNNLPMGVERVGNRLFVTLPRRRFGIPSTLNYLDLTLDKSLSPGLRPYPDLRRAQALTSVYRTRADHCRRLWMVDTGLLEIPDNRSQVQRPAIVIYDLNTDEQIRRYDLKNTDVISENTPTGLASITLDFVDPSDCNHVYAYIPDLTTYGLIVYSFRENDSWRLSHNYFSFDPLAGNLNIAGQSFQWSDGIFSITLRETSRGSCPVAYFHAMVGTAEFSVPTCVLRNRTASQDSQFYQQFAVVGDRGEHSQSTMHGYHAGTNVLFFADMGRDAVSCWNTAAALTPRALAIVAQDSQWLSYPSDLHVTGDEVWVMANTLPRWGYGRLDTNQYNYHIYSGNVHEMIANTVCASPRFHSRSGASGESSENDTTARANASAEQTTELN